MRLGAVLNLDPEQIFEARQAGEETGACGYLSAAVVALEPMTVCAEKATVQVSLGFHVPIETEGKERTQRIQIECRIRDRFVWKPSSTDKIPNVGNVRTINMGASETDDPDEGYIMGGITWQFDTTLEKAD